jgi:excisionase family DNA binding protein
MSSILFGGTLYMANSEEISAIEAARRLGVGLDYLYSLLWTGKLQGRKVGKQWRVSAQAVDSRLKRSEREAGQS